MDAEQYGLLIELEQKRVEVRDKEEVYDFISYRKKRSQYSMDPDQKPKLNILCYLEDWDAVKL